MWPTSAPDRLHSMTTQLEQQSSHSLAPLVTIAEGTAVALVVWAVGWLAGVPYTVRQNGHDQTIGATSVTVATVLAGLAGWAVLAILNRFVAQPRRVWTFVAAGVLVLSLLGPLGSAVGTSTTVTLVLLHLCVGGLLIGELGRQSSR